MSTRPDEFSVPSAENVEQPIATASTQLAAVRLLLSTDRDARVSDLLLATTFEYLDSGPKTSQEVVNHLNHTWPGLHLSREVIDETLRVAAESQYVSRQQDLGARSAWRLERRGELDLNGSKQWADDILARTSAEIGREALDYFGQSDPERARRWTELLLEAISACLVAGFTADAANVRIVGESLLVPAAVDLDVVDARLESLVTDADVLDFLRSLARMAMDASSLFGTELVHTLTLGYVLHAFAAGYDHADLRRSTGSFSRESLVLDTPLLLQLAGPSSGSEPVWTILRRSRQEGVRIVVHERTAGELERLLLARDEDARAVERVLSNGDAEAVHLAATVRDQVLQLWLRATPEGANGWLPWETFRSRCMTVLTTIQAFGGETDAPVPADRLAERPRFIEAIRSSLDGRGKRRGHWNIEHDAELLLSLASLRRAAPPNHTKAWPGGFIISTDSHLTESYRAVVTDEPSDFPAVITLGQWASMLAKCCDPGGMESLAASVSAEVSARATLARASAMPIDAAIEVARSLKGSSVSGAALGSVQLTLDELLAEQIELDGSSATTPRELASRVLAERHAKLERVATEQRRAAEGESTRAEKYRAVREAQLLTGQETANATAERERVRADRLARANSELENTIDAERQESTTRLRRAIFSVALTLLLVGVVVGLTLSDSIGRRGTVAGSAGVVILALACFDWTKNLDRGWLEVGGPLLASAAWLTAELTLGSGGS